MPVGDQMKHLSNIHRGAKDGDRLWSLFLNNIGRHDENKFNRRAAWKLWRETNNALAEERMHLSPAYKERFLESTAGEYDKKQKKDFDGLIATLNDEMKYKSRLEFLLEDKYDIYLPRILEKDMEELGCNNLNPAQKTLERMERKKETDP